jgi:hypothetical protein
MTRNAIAERSRSLRVIAALEKSGAHRLPSFVALYLARAIIVALAEENAA